MSENLPNKYIITWLCGNNYVAPIRVNITYQIMKDIPLMQMNGDERLKLPTLNLGEVLCGHVD